MRRRSAISNRIRSRVMFHGSRANGMHNYRSVVGNYLWLAYDKNNKVLGSVFTSGVESDALNAARNKFGFMTVSRVDMSE